MIKKYYYQHYYTVIWKNWDGTVLETDPRVLAGSTPTYNGSTPARAASVLYTYAFSGWSPSIVPVSADAVYTALFTATLNKYTVTWKNEDGTTNLETDANVDYGTTVAYNGATPTKSATAQYIYTFDGWSDTAGGSKAHEINFTPTVEGNASYYAHFAATVNNYTVTFLPNISSRGSVSPESLTVPYGSIVNVSSNTITINGNTVTATPKPRTSQAVYSFANWSGIPANNTIIGNTTITANFNSTPLITISVTEPIFNTQTAGSGTYEEGTSVIISALSTYTDSNNTVWVFWRWDDYDTHDTRTITISSDKTEYKAYFKTLNVYDYAQFYVHGDFDSLSVRLLDYDGKYVTYSKSNIGTNLKTTRYFSTLNYTHRISVTLPVGSGGTVSAHWENSQDDILVHSNPLHANIKYIEVDFDSHDYPVISINAS